MASLTTHKDFLSICLQNIHISLKGRRKTHKKAAPLLHAAPWSMYYHHWSSTSNTALYRLSLNCGLQLDEKKWQMIQGKSLVNFWFRRSQNPTQLTKETDTPLLDSRTHTRVNLPSLRLFINLFLCLIGLLNRLAFTTTNLTSLYNTGTYTQIDCS